MYCNVIWHTCRHRHIFLNFFMSLGRFLLVTVLWKLNSLNVKWIPRSPLGKMLVFFFLCSMFASLLRVGHPVRHKICLKSQCEHLANTVEDILNRCFSINLSHSNPVADLPRDPPVQHSPGREPYSQMLQTQRLSAAELAPCFHIEMYVWCLRILSDHF